MTDLGPFHGIDAHPGIANKPGFLLSAQNVLIAPDRALVRRPGLAFRAALPADSFEIYTVGDQLRTMAPYSTGDAALVSGLLPTLGVDFFTPSAALAYTMMGRVQGTDGSTLALLHRSDGLTELHHCPATLGSAPGTTALTPGFTPTIAMARVAGRAWTLEASAANLRGSAVDAITPSNLDLWTTGSLATDPVSFNVAQFAAGQGAPTAIASYRGRIVVLYPRQAQVWFMDPNPERIYTESILSSAGTRFSRTCAEVEEALIYLADAGVRKLGTNAVTTEPVVDGIGAPVDPLVRSLMQDLTIIPRAFYAQSLNCYLLAFGSLVMCMSIIPGQGPLGWTTWQLPFPVDAWAEAGGVLWMRSGSNLYSFDRTLDQDHPTGTTSIPVVVSGETVPIRGSDYVMAMRVAASPTEALLVQVVADGRPGVDTEGVPMGLPITIPARSPEMVGVNVGKLGRSFTVRWYDADSAATWRLDNVALTVGAA